MPTAIEDPYGSEDDGWVTRGQQPAVLCRMCLDGYELPGVKQEPVERENITLRGLVVCPVCDMVEAWP